MTQMSEHISTPTLPPLSLCPSAETCTPLLRSRPARLAAAAQLTRALTGRDDAPCKALTAWRHVDLMAAAHAADASLTAALATAQHAPANVRAHYLLALLHWLLADLAGKAAAHARHSQADMHDDGKTPNTDAEADAKPAKKRKKGSASVTADTVGPAAPSPADVHSSAAPALAVVVSDPRPWWLLAAILSSPTLPRQEVQAGRLAEASARSLPGCSRPQH